MKKNVKVEVPEKIEKSQAIVNYKEDIKDIKELLEKILEKISLMKLNGGFD